MADPGRGFGPAGPEERCVFGARRPGYPDSPVQPAEVDRWISFMRSAGIDRVVCLLSKEQLTGYDDLRGRYEEAFGSNNVLFAPVEDYTLADLPTLSGRILPFLAETDGSGRKAVVHCAGGIGRTGHVLAAWLAAYRGMTSEEAIGTVKKSGRNAGESGDPGLEDLLDSCREASRNAGNSSPKL
jgi:protein-tyrosine phosphatase